MRPHFNGKKLDMVAYTCHPTIVGSVVEEDHDPGQPGQKV
jgi:hypothetical protein